MMEWQGRIGERIMFAPVDRVPGFRVLCEIADVVKRWGRTDVILRPIGGEGEIAVSVDRLVGQGNATP